jgi:hypothetical protein
MDTLALLGFFICTVVLLGLIGESCSCSCHKEDEPRDDAEGEESWGEEIDKLVLLRLRVRDAVGEEEWKKMEDKRKAARQAVVDKYHTNDKETTS